MPPKLALEEEIRLYAYKFSISVTAHVQWKIDEATTKVQLILQNRFIEVLLENPDREISENLLRFCWVRPKQSDYPGETCSFLESELYQNRN